MKELWKLLWPWIKGAAVTVWKHWRSTVGSLFALGAAWMYLMEKIDFQTAAGALTILWIGGYVNRRLDFSVISKVFKEEKESGTDEQPQE